MTRSCIDLFSGAGGLSEGLSQAGFHSLYASEIVAPYARTYQKNHPSAFVQTADIRTVDAYEVMEQLGVKPGELDLIAGGPPCQGFSINAPVRSTEDHRNHLFREYLGSSSKPPSLNDGGADLFKRVTFDQVLKSVESSRER